MPEGGVDLQPQSKMLTQDEIIRLSSMFVQAGVDKIRLTGGEVGPYGNARCGIRKKRVWGLHRYISVSSTSAWILGPIIVELSRRGYCTSYALLPRLSLEPVGQNHGCHSTEPQTTSCTRVQLLIVMLCKRSLPSICNLETCGTIDVD